MTLAAAPQADADIQALLQVKKYREAFALLLPRYRDKVFRLTFSMLRNHAMAEDTTQDVFLRVWRALPGYAGQSSLSTWIYAISTQCLPVRAAQEAAARSPWTATRTSTTPRWRPWPRRIRTIPRR